MKKFKYKIIKFNTSSRSKYYLLGGALHGNTIRLTSPSTLIFKLQGFVGRYISKHEHIDTLHWEDVNIS